jgi:hypothetical protein
MKGRSSAKPIPYVSFTTFLTALDAFRRVRRGALRREHLNGGAYTSWDQLSRTLRVLDLVDGQMMPTSLFRTLLIGDRKSSLAKILKQHYRELISNLARFTPEQLDQTLEDTYGLSGTTVTKARSFLLGAARYCDLPISPELAATVRNRSSRKYFDLKKRKSSTGNFRAIEPNLSENKTLSLTADDMTITVSFRRGSLPEISKTEHELMAHLFGELQAFKARAKEKNRRLRSVPQSWSPASDDD